MSILSWIFFGLLAGLIAKMLRPGKDPGGFLVTVMIGIAGAIIGGWIGTLLGWGTVTGWDFRSFLLAVGGAIVLLFLISKLRRKK